jgi:uncharacterized protein YhbP (UPF0306 family)
MEPLELVRDYLSKGRIMQIATTDGDQPWICSVYYVEDDKLNLYWLSLPTRRHSQQIAKNNKVAISIAIKADQPVIGIQAEGVAEVVERKTTVAKMMLKYVARFAVGGRFYDNLKKGKNQHVMYRFVPRTMVLFDEVTFPGDGRKEISL